MYSGNFLHSDYLLARPKARLAVPVDLINSQPIIRVIPSPDYKIGSIANFLRKPDVPNLRVLAKWLKEKDLDIFVGGSVIYNPFVGKTKNQYKDIDVTAVSEDQGKINLVMEYLDVLVTEQIPFITDLHSSWLYGYKSKSS